MIAHAGSLLGPPRSTAGGTVLSARGYVAALVLVGVLATVLAARFQLTIIGMWLAVELAAATVGALVGFLIALPGYSPSVAAKGAPAGGAGESPSATDSTSIGHAVVAAQRYRITVFSDWLVGGAFALVLANGAAIVRSIQSASEWVVNDDVATMTAVERTEQVALIAFAVAFAVGSFIVAWWQTTTHGNRLLGRP